MVAVESDMAKGDIRLPYPRYIDMKSNTECWCNLKRLVYEVPHFDTAIASTEAKGPRTLYFVLCALCVVFCVLCSRKPDRHARGSYTARSGIFALLL